MTASYYQTTDEGFYYRAQRELTDGTFVCVTRDHVVRRGERAVTGTFGTVTDRVAAHDGTSTLRIRVLDGGLPGQEFAMIPASCVRLADADEVELLASL